MPGELWFSREIAEGVTWLGGCNPAVISGREFHGHVSCYLIRGSQRSLLFDTGYLPQWPMLEAALDGALAGGLWYLYFRLVDRLPDDKARPEAARLGFQEDACLDAKLGHHQRRRHTLPRNVSHQHG